MKDVYYGMWTRITALCIAGASYDSALDEVCHLLHIALRGKTVTVYVRIAAGEQFDIYLQKYHQRCRILSQRIGRVVAMLHQDKGT